MGNAEPFPDDGTPRDADPESGADPEPGAAAKVASFLLFGLSLPERAVRSTIALAAGTAAEAAKVLVPRAFQDSKTYEIVVRNSLRFMTDEIGGATTPNDDQSMAGTEYMARKAVGNFVDMAGILTLHASPLWILAAFSDVAYGSKVYLRELAGELREQGLIAEGSTIDRAEDVLEAMRAASGGAAGLVDTPPLSIDGLKDSLAEMRRSVASADYLSLLPQQELARAWEEMRAIARRDGVSMLEISTALTFLTLGKLGALTHGAWTGLRVAGGMLNRTVVGHYAQALATVREKGFYATIQESYEPYVGAVWVNFSRERSTVTEGVLSGRYLRRAFKRVCGWLGRSESESRSASESDTRKEATQ